MLQEHTDGTKLGPGFDTVGINIAVDQDYPNDWEMEDTTSNSVKVVGEVVVETDVSSLGLSPQVGLTTDSLQNVTGPSTAAVWNLGDAGSDVNESLFSGANVAETTATVDSKHSVMCSILRNQSPCQGEGDPNHLMIGLNMH